MTHVGDETRDALTATGREARAHIAATAQLACLLEASAPKPGNVSPGRRFADLGYEDFLAAAVAIGEPLAGAGDRALGATVRLAVEAAARWTRTNTNLGIVLLLTPLARAALVMGSDPIIITTITSARQAARGCPARARGDDH